MASEAAVQILDLANRPAHDYQQVVHDHHSGKRTIKFLKERVLDLSCSEMHTSQSAYHYDEVINTIY